MENELLSIEEYFVSRLGYELTKGDKRKALDKWKKASEYNIRIYGCSFCDRFLSLYKDTYSICAYCPLKLNNICIEYADKSIIFYKWRDGRKKKKTFYAKQIYNAIAEIWNRRYPKEIVKLYRVV